MPTQIQIDALKTKVDLAKSLVDTAYARVQDWFSLIKNCDIKNRGALQAGDIEDGQCGKGSAKNHPGCASKDTCQNNVSTYNSAVTDWENKTTDYQNAQDEYQNALDGLGGNEGGNGSGNKEASFFSKYKTVIIFLVIVIIVIVAGILIYRKIKK